MASPENFKHKRQRPRRALSIDGFITPPSDKKHGGSINFGREDGQRARSATVDNFRRAEGFHPGNQPIVNLQNKFQQPVTHPGDIPEPKKTKHRKRVKRSWRKILFRSASSFAILLVLVGSFLLIKSYIKARQIFKGGASGAVALQGEVDPSQLKIEGDGRVNIMVLGKGGEGHEGADLTDTLLVLSIDPIRKEAGIVSIPRDLYVQVPDDGSEKINAVYANAKSAILDRASRPSDELNKQAEKAGISKVQTIMSEVLGIPIHYSAMIDFEGFRQAIDTVGGIDVTVKEQLYDPSVAWENNNNPLIAAAGKQTFNGKKALLYARSRHGSVRGDFDRAERQREILVALKDKVLSTSTFANPVKISQLLDAFGNHVQTDLSLNEVQKLYDIAKAIPSDKIVSIGFADPPIDLVTTGNAGGLSVVLPTAGLYKYDEIHAYVRNTLRDSYLRRENARVVVLNGTTTGGLATLRGVLLRSLGYNVSEIGDAPNTSYTQTVVVDLHGDKKYTRSYLEKRFKVVPVSSMPDKVIDAANADFVIILGANETTSR